ncbi:hypothetical protein Avbf_05374 [Armadillidium vulgare]|nr:hypothetical protein Avbf_05374 [Armadillidium vulgare]
MTKSKSFFQLLTSLPVVSDAVSYVTESYNGVKGKNALVGAFLGGVERSVFRATYAAYHISKVAVPYDYLDHLASEELIKAEEKFPVIKKPSKQVWKEFTTCTLSKISGVTAKKRIPTTLSEAVKIRISCVAKCAANIVSETIPMKMVAKVSHKILDKVEEAIEVVVPEKKPKSKPRTKSDLLMERVLEIINRTKVKLVDVAKEIAELKGKHHHHHHKKETKGWPEKYFDRTKHFIKMAITGTVQSIVGGVNATLPALERFFEYIKERAQMMIKRAEEDGRYLATEAYRECKVILKDLIEIIKGINIRKIPGSIIRALELFWREITNERLTISFTVISESLAASAGTKESTEDTDKMVGATSSEA